MKKIFLTLLTLLTTATLWAQAPQRMSYQSVIRDGNNVVVASTTVGVKISLLQGTAAGSAVYVETHRKATNANGLLSLEIGDGTAISGTFAGIDWANGPYLIKTETDPTGGTNYSIPGIAALNSVPYALFSANGNGTPGPQGATGPQGPIGLTGAVGLQGAKGDSGDTGPIGPAGVGTNGIDGIAGPVGPQGPIGLTGAVGLQGAKGDSGDTGPIGPAGVGTNGIDGIAGPVGPQGPIGLTGAQGIQGLAGTNGANGAVGSNGLDGKTVLNGTVDPTNQGVNGDFYINTATNTLFGPKASGAWPTGVSLVGAAGIQGIQGITGVVGPAPSGTGIVTVSGGTLQTPSGLTGDVTTTGAGLATTIATDAVTSGKILDGTIATADLANSAVTDEKIAGVAGSKVTGNITGNAANVTGTVAVVNGGTGATTLTGLVKGNGTDAMTAAIVGTDYQAPLALTTTGSGAATLTGAALNIPTLASGTAAGDMLYWNGSAWVKVAAGTDGQTLTFVGGKPAWTNTISFWNSVVSPTGKIWMDRNLGASQVATSSTDAASYGDLYQWGRGSDGHQIRTSPTTTTLSTTDQPGNGNFILAPNSPYDWRSPQNTNLWQGVAGVNNPCPSGYRIPTDTEWEAERSSWTGTGGNNSVGAFGSPLKLPMAGSRLNNGTLNQVNTRGRYWSSTVNDTESKRLYFDTGGSAITISVKRAEGSSVRCIKD